MGSRGRSGVFAAIALLAAALSPAVAQASTITVTTSADEFFGAGGTGCSMREAVSTAAANATTANGCSYPAGGINDTIQFASSSVHPVLTIAPDGTPDDNADGDLDVEADPATEGTLTIQGLGQGTTTVEGGVGLNDGPDRLIDQEDGTLTIQDLTLKDGNTAAAEPGGGIRSRPGTLAADTLTVNRVTFNNNTADTNGGGIDATGVAAVNITDSMFEFNHARGAGGSGGGINVGPSVANFSFTGGQIADNDLIPNDDQTRRGGGFANRSAGTVTISGATIATNQSGGGWGDGVANLVGTLNISGSTITGNGNSTVSGGGRGLQGGGVYAAGTNTNITNSAITGNEVSPTSQVNLAGGAGVAVQTNATLTDTVVSGNDVVEENIAASSLSGAGLSNAGTLTLNRSTVSGNFFGTAGPGDGSPHFGAAIASNSASSNVTLLNSTVTGNTDTDADPIAGTIVGFQSNTFVNIVHSTIAGNSHSASAFDISFPGIGSSAVIRGSVIADDPNACGTNIMSEGFNVDAGGSCPVGPGGVSNAAPLLGALATNGGPTQTMALLAGSPAIDLVPLAACTDDASAALTVDQRGFARPVPAGGSCDAGAYEFVPGPPAATPPANPPTAPKKKCKKKKKHRAASAKKKKCKKKKRR
jgi:CSLREA domain-containing protein